MELRFCVTTGGGVQGCSTLRHDGGGCSYHGVGAPLCRYGLLHALNGLGDTVVDGVGVQGGGNCDELGKLLRERRPSDDDERRDRGIQRPLSLLIPRHADGDEARRLRRSGALRSRERSGYHDRVTFIVCAREHIVRDRTGAQREGSLRRQALVARVFHTAQVRFVFDADT